MEYNQVMHGTIFTISLEPFYKAKYLVKFIDYSYFLTYPKDSPVPNNPIYAHVLKITDETKWFANTLFTPNNLLIFPVNLYNLNFLDDDKHIRFMDYSRVSNQEYFNNLICIATSYRLGTKSYSLDYVDQDKFTPYFEYPYEDVCQFEHNASLNMTKLKYRIIIEHMKLYDQKKDFSKIKKSHMVDFNELLPAFENKKAYVLLNENEKTYNLSEYEQIEHPDYSETYENCKPRYALNIMLYKIYLTHIAY